MGGSTGKVPMAVKVSVVVAVYNPGDNIERLLASLDDQSLPVDEFEVVFVDDGSTDETPERLRAFAAQRPNVTVTTIPNSGWPGRPRNVGTDLATGDYVFYADHDDELFPEALERMHDLAAANGSDIVYGKVVTPGMPTPFWPLARRTIGQADLVADGLLLNRMVHKLYRRQLLLDHGIRFAEGPVRLEDHMFMAQAMPLAKVISVLADYPCYRWVVRNDGTNNSADQVDFPGYWDYLATSMDLFTERAGPGLVDDAARAWAGQRMLLHVRPGPYFALDQQARDAMLSPLYDLVCTRLPERVDPLVPVLKRLRLRELRSRNRERFDRLQKLTDALTFPVSLDRVEWSDGVLRLAASSTLTGSAGSAGAEVAVERDGADLLLLLDEVDPDVPASARTLLPSDAGTLELTVRHRDTGVEWPLHGIQRAVLAPSGDGLGLTVTWDGELDICNGAFGGPLEVGIWDVLARVQFLGEAWVLRLPVADDLDPPEGSATTAAGVVLAYRTATSTLAVRIVALNPQAVQASWQDDVLHLSIEPPVNEPAAVVARERGQQDGWEAPVVGGAAAVSFAPSRPGQIVDLWLRTGPAGGPKERRLVFALTDFVQRPNYNVYETAHGSLSVRHAPPSARQPAFGAKRGAGGPAIRALSALSRLGRLRK